MDQECKEDIVRKKYKKRMDNYNKYKGIIKNKISFIGALRFIVVLGTLVSCGLFYKMRSNALFLTSMIVGIILFSILVIIHQKKKNTLNKLDKLINLNMEEEKTLKELWSEEFTKGDEFIDRNHPFSSDLDLFGKHSLYHHINRCNSAYGEKELASSLLGDKKWDLELLKRRNDSIKEISEYIDFYQRLYVEGENLRNISIDDLEELTKWAKERNKFFNENYIKYITNIIPVLSISTLVLGIFKIIPYTIFLLIFLSQIIIIFLGKKYTEEHVQRLNKYKKVLNNYSETIKICERRNFKTEELKNIAKQFKKGEKSATKGIEELEKLSFLCADKHNVLHLPINILFLLDYRLSISLEGWRSEYGEHLEGWFKALGKIEELASFGNIYGKYSGYSFANIVKDNQVLEGQNISHPLIGEKAIPNTASINNQNRILLITGSNMSGKSTFLRTIGINLVLSYAGAPIKGEKFNCSIMDIYTCMRTFDDLENSISSFYAEILRVKMLTEGVKKDVPVIFLLDELFKGTNSRDRHKGAEMLLKNLEKKKAIGLLSTHDLELCDLENENPHIKNYHFEEYYEDNKLLFDYKLKNGKSTRGNAVYLMKMAGIDMD